MPSSAESGRALRERFEQWRRFAEWEAQEERRTSRSFEADLAWFSDALAFAEQVDPGAGDFERVRRKAAQIARLRAMLSGRRRPAA